MPKRFYVFAALLLCAVTSADGSDVNALKLTAIDFPGAHATTALGINSSGQIVGEWEEAITRLGRGFILSSGVYTPIDVPQALHTTASGINDFGNIVGTYFAGEPDGTVTAVHGFILTPGGQFTTITFPGAVVTSAFGINNMGQIVGAFIGAGDLGVHGFLFDAGTFTQIDFPMPGGNPTVTFAIAINDAGDIVGGYNDDDIFQSRRGYVLRGGVFHRFDVPGSTMTDLFGVNNAGEIVGMFQDSRDAQFYSFLFSPKRGVSRLGTSGNPKQRLALTATGINDAGQIVGSSFDGTLRGFLANPPSKRR